MLQRTTDPLQDVDFGDFDGDGKADIFRATGVAWEYSRGGTEPFQLLNTAPQTLEQLMLGDFNGDGITDVFIAENSKWWYYSG